MKNSCLTFLLSLFTFCLFGQQDSIVRRTYMTEMVTKAPEIDGVLSDAAWQEVEPASGFVQNSPRPGAGCSQNTAVRMIYDDEAVYIAAELFENNPDSINNFLTERDDVGNADYFKVVFNNYRDGINGEGFAVTPAGVQIDTKYSTSGESSTWDAVWESATNITERGWIVEIKIPFSALRFPEVKEQVWGINFGRQIRRNREISWWNFVNPEIDGFFTQAGRLKGIENIKPPTRLFFFPYASGYIEHSTVEEGGVAESFNAGMDVKYGINDAFTLDMTLIPDFGQARFDNRVLNLSPFEVQYNENRQFFTEGVELFNKAGLFYSRRVGGRPINFSKAQQSVLEEEEVVENPNRGQLINATKISGRNKRGLGIGFFNAVENETKAVIENTETGETRELTTNPLTNYNVLVLDQVIRNNSFVTFTNTNVLRSGSVYDANVSRVDLKLTDKKNKYALEGFGGVSQKFHPDSISLGETYSLGFSKISGNWRFKLSQTVIGKEYDINDLGFQTIRNVNQSYATVSFQKFEPFSIFNNMRHNLSMNYERLLEPSTFFNFAVYSNSFFTLRNFHSFGFNAAWEPVDTYDYFETRTFERAYEFPQNYSLGAFVSSDYSRPFALDAGVDWRQFDEVGRNNFSYYFEPRIRPNDKLFFVIGYSNAKRNNEMGYVNTLSDTIVFGRRNVEIHESFISGSYIFNNKMWLTLDLRHYWSTAVYDQFNNVQEDGSLTPSEFAGFNPDGSSVRDISFNAFNIDLIYKWRFAPGSEISVAWKLAILEEGEPSPLSYYEDVETTLRAPQVNNFSIKVLYFIDYLYLKKR
ncbi:DUF5916 domain-containing protein [Halocola ammonii]